MGRELRIRVREDRTPPQFDGLEGFEVDDEEWRLSLDAHRDLLVELTGVEPDGDLMLQELVTIRARLEGYIERTSRPAKGAVEGPVDEDRDRSQGRVKRFLEWLRTAIAWIGRDRFDEGTARKDDEGASYSDERIRHLAAAFRAAADARRREIAGPNAASAGQPAAD
ncbi:hypothetical protein [Halopiger xanaduensis]|uniref:Uncharacterized protein n=1 Tax=Halopiger xanaduensis (strain DSM 18323 / JCM 14033 / SH-6) TaxID=797210 RepID=F8D2X1_HALXS|nr:hypothetical protein [Halopiger xanaduensis]AEH36114.1 hypothetical protein Halxa_1481 [Halopiger xanaduensis SH-6]